ncbi:MAG: CHAT domain-containing protein [Bacteroidales bacterium]|nr:CHAT domain-containing protein [Bacteroidales bacterium]
MKGIYFSELNQSDSAIHYFRTAIQITQNPDSLAQIYLFLSEEHRLNNNPQQAFEYLGVLKKLAGSGKILDKTIVYESLHLEAKIKISLADYLGALKLFDSTLAMIEQIEGKLVPASIKVINFKGIAFYYLGDQEQAFYYYREALEKCLKLQIRNIDLADIYQNMAISYSYKGEFDSALVFLEKSRIVREEIFSDSHPRMAGFYVNYGRILSLVGRTGDAFLLYQKADNIMREYASENYLWWGHLKMNIGSYLQLRNEYEKALVYYQSALKIYQHHFRIENPLIIAASSNVANIYNQLGEFEKARDNLVMFSSFSGNALNKVQLSRNLGHAYNGLGDYASALFHYKNAVDISLKNLGEYHLETANSMITLADYFRETGDIDAAISYFSDAADIVYKIFGKNDTEYADVIRKLARAYSFKQDFVRADSLYAVAESILMNPNRANSESESFSEINSLINTRLVDVYFWWASLYYNWSKDENDLNKLKKSIVLFDKAIDITDQIGLFLTDESRMLLNQNFKTKLAEAIDAVAVLWYHTHDTIYADKAFYYAEKGRASVLLASIRKSDALFLSGVQDSVIKYEQQLHDDLSVIQKLLYEEQQKSFPDENRIALLEKRQLYLMESIDKIILKIRTEYPDYVNLMSSSGVISLSEVQNRLKVEDFFVSYASGEKQYYLIYADKKSRGLIKIDAENVEVEKYIDHILSQFRMDLSRQSNSDFQDFLKSSGFLYYKLIKPIADMAEGKKLLILPEGKLGYLPFDVLVSDENLVFNRIDYRNLPYLIHRHPISYCYSATLHFSQNERKQKGNGKLMAFAPDYSGFKSVSINEEDTITLSELPFARIESERVLSVFGGELAVGKDATKSGFLDQAADYSYLHLAMHTIINDDKPLYSRLIFQQQEDSLDAYSIGTYELFGLDLNASLVVLSACNTGTGKFREGEGIISLTRGFIHAGVPSIVMTNWEVHDQTGSWMMERFYNYLADGMSKDIALQQAKIDFLEQANQLKAHPYFWASYVVIGDATPISKGHLLNWYVGVGVIVLLLILLPGYRLIRGKISAKSLQ